MSVSAMMSSIRKNLIFDFYIEAVLILKQAWAWTFSLFALKTLDKEPDFKTILTSRIFANGTKLREFLLPMKYLTYCIPQQQT